MQSGFHVQKRVDGGGESIHRSELARERGFPDALALRLPPLPLPSPLPEGRGGLSVPREVMVSVGSQRTSRLTQEYPSAPNSPLSLQGGARSRGLGRGSGVEPRARFASKLAPMYGLTPTVNPLLNMKTRLHLCIRPVRGSHVGLLANIG